MSRALFVTESLAGDQNSLPHSPDCQFRVNDPAAIISDAMLTLTDGHEP